MSYEHNRPFDVLRISSAQFLVLITSFANLNVVSLDKNFLQERVRLSEETIFVSKYWVTVVLCNEYSGAWECDGKSVP
jgi:hypothetical protein